MEQTGHNAVSGPPPVDREVAAGTPDLPVFQLHWPKTLDLPVLYNSPHSGRVYPPDLMARTALGDLDIRGSEDCFVDLLFAAAPVQGAPLIAATYPRAYVDINREPYELDPAMFAEELPPHVTCSSQRIAAGLGTIPRLVAPGRAIYRDKLHFSEARDRIERIHRPYHQKLKALLDQFAARSGAVVLIDCHSMPSGSQSPLGSGRCPDIILGDRFGRSCAAGITQLARTLWCDLGYSVEMNEPYAGGYDVVCYGQPQAGRHALQIELSRALYVEEDSLVLKPGFAALCRDVERWMARFHKGLMEMLPELAAQGQVSKAAE